jgi:flagellar biosynthesis protein FlhG
MSDAAIHPGRVDVAGVAPSGPDDQATRLRAMVEAVERRQAKPAVSPASMRGDLRAAPVRRARIITVSSGKGGVGKTNTCVNLAIALTQLGKRTTLLDADLGMANADVLCGLTPVRRLDQFVGVSDGAQPALGAVRTTRLLREIAVEAPGGFRLIPGAVGVARMADLAPREQARLLAGLDELERDADVLIVDTGAGLGPEIISFIHAADLAVIIATPEPTSIADAYALIKCSVLAPRQARRAHGLRPDPATNAPRLGLVVNQAAEPQEAAGVHARIAGVCQRFLGYPLPLVGWVTQDARVGGAVRKRRPVLLESEKCQASRDLRELAGAIARILEPPLDPAKGPEEPEMGQGWLKRLILRGR